MVGSSPSRSSAASARRSAMRCAACCFPRSRARRSRPFASKGVLHEFSSLQGVVEDMTDVVLNLKQIPFKLHGGGPKTLFLEKKGPGVVTAADIDEDPDVEILDPTAHIATPFEGRLAEDGVAPQARPRLRRRRPQRRPRSSARVHPGRLDPLARPPRQLPRRRRARRADDRLRPARARGLDQRRRLPAGSGRPRRAT